VVYDYNNYYSYDYEHLSKILLNWQHKKVADETEKWKRKKHCRGSNDRFDSWARPLNPNNIT